MLPRIHGYLSRLLAPEDPCRQRSAGDEPVLAGIDCGVGAVSLARSRVTTVTTLSRCPVTLRTLPCGCFRAGLGCWRRMERGSRYGVEDPR